MENTNQIKNVKSNDSGMYRSSFKSIFVFGGVKFFLILIKLVAVKVVAIILGPAGMGIQSLLSSLSSTLHQFTTFGIYQSSVRDISYNSVQSKEKTLNIIGTLNTLSLLFGLLGLLICIFFSRTLSQYVFGSKDYALLVISVGFALLFEAIYCGKVAVLQALRKIKILAWSSLSGGIASLLISVPLYYFFGEKSIPYVLVFSTMVVCFFYWYYSHKLGDEAPDSLVGLDKLKEFGPSMIKLGSILMFSNGVVVIYSLILNVFIREFGSYTDVGLFNGASTATYGCITVLISTLAIDLYPRLSAMTHDKELYNKTVNLQLELLLLIAAPIICFLTIYPQFVVQILLSKSYYVIIPLVQLMSIALLFRILWHTFSFVILSHGHRNTYFIYDAIIGNGLNFVMNIIAYYYWGLNGLAYSYVCGAISMSIILFCLMKFKYKLKFSSKLKAEVIAFVSVAVLSYIVKIWLGDKTIIPSLLILVSISIVSIYLLNKRIGFIQLVKSKFTR